VNIPLAKSDIGDAETSAVVKVMASGRIAFGPEMVAFEREFAHYHDVPDALMVNSGTSGLMVSLLAAGVKPGDEVILPALTFLGSVNAILAVGAVPVLVDVTGDTANIDPALIEAAITPKTRAIMPVHLFGLPADMTSILALGEAHQLFVAEDACEAIGADVAGRKAGSLGAAGVFGFYPNKVLTTGEGGMIIGRDQTFIDRCRAMINQGRGKDGVSLPGHSLRGTELGAAIGRVQLVSLDARRRARTVLAAHYRDVIKEIPGIEVPWQEDRDRSWFTFPVLLPNGANRPRIMERLKVAGIESADYFPALQTLPAYAGEVRQTGPLSSSASLGARLLCLPFWQGMTSEPEMIAGHLADALGPP
jgi:perosamine synthetase